MGYEHIVEVKYKNELPTQYDVAYYLGHSGLCTRWVVDLFLARKAKCWNYEDEWRTFVKFNDPHQFIKVKKEAICEVVFGAKADDKTIDKVKGWIKEGGLNPRLYKATTDYGQYKLKINKL